MKTNHRVLTIVITTLSIAMLGISCNDCEDCTKDSAPTVVSTSPADGETNVAGNATISITFSEPIDVSTVSVNNGPGCIGSIQVFRVSDNYCCQINIAGSTISNLNKTFTFTHAVWGSGTWKIRVTTAVTDSSAGNPLSTEYVHTTGFTVP